jgi:SPP1 gp7 family putative phage head morphogenesis protein
MARSIHRSDGGSGSAAALRTATYVRAALRAGHGKRRRRPPKPQWPFALERQYASDLASVITDLRQKADAALAELPALLESARREREDAADRELLGLHVVIENPAGSIRTWTDADGTTGQTVMRWSYGYLDGFEGADGEDVDVYVGPELEPAEVYVVHQRRKGSPEDEHWLDYDEDKVMLGWKSADAAKTAYLAQYDDARFFGGMSVFTADDFKRRLVANPGRKLTHADPRARVLRLDVGEGRRARVLMDKVREGLTSSESKAEHAAESVAGQVADFQKKLLGKQSAAAFGVDITPLLTDPKKAAQIDAFVHENVSLIKTLGTNTLGELEKLITRGFADGKRASELGAEIEKRWGIAQRHARLIARDQIGKLNGQITRSRHEELGVAQFRWLTMKDPKVRPRHQPMEGKTFAYKGEGAPPFYPGQEVCCRCLEEPLFDDIMGILDAMMAEPPAIPVEDTPEFQAESARRAAASAEATTVAAQDLAAFEANQAAAKKKEQEWAAKVAAAKAKQAAAFEALKAKLAAEQAAKDAELAAHKAAAELAAKQAAEKKAAEEAAKKAAEEKAAAEAAAAAKKAKASDAAKKGAATKKANKEAAKAAAAAQAAQASVFTPGELATYQGKLSALQTSANTAPPAGWSAEKHAAQAAAKDALALHTTPKTPAEMLKAAEAFEAVAAKAQAAGSYWGTPYTELAQELRDRVNAVELERAREARRAARAAQAATPQAPAQPIRYASMRPDDFNGFHGQGFVQDADAIEGGTVRVVRVQGHDGKEYYEAVFKVTAPYGEQARKFGTSDRQQWPFRGRQVRNGKMVDLHESDGHASSNKSRVRTEGRQTFEIGLDGALANQVRVRAPSLEALDDAMGKFSRHIGANTQIEPTRADLELQAKARVAAKYDPKTFGSLMTRARTVEDQLDAIEQVFAAQARKHPELHDVVEDAEIREVYPGHRVLYSETLGKTLAQKFGAMYHDGNPPAEVAASIVGDTGLMSSAKRYHSGVFTRGMSTGTDFGTGGADGVFMRLSKDAPSSSGGNFRAVIDTEKVMGRLDWWAFDFDNYGTSSYGATGSREGYQKRFSVPEMKRGSATYGNEVMAPQGIPPSAFKKFIVTDQSYRRKVLEELRNKGITEINGQPIEQFVTTG